MFKYRQGSAGREPASRAESGAKAGIRCESPGQPVEMSGKLASVSASRPRGMTWEDWKSCKKLPKDEHLRGVIIGLGGKRMLCDHNHPWGQATRRLLQNITLGTICAPKGYAFFCKPGDSGTTGGDTHPLDAAAAVFRSRVSPPGMNPQMNWGCLYDLCQLKEATEEEIVALFPQMHLG
ncbi:uncharacterized protein LOC141560526 isoform X2 [Sminthopsis crassicaudata]|uniref:uncharacterized protein LOC141560526 isoform X2 n=1 Tax=Sminthopsis crassicaudata TaxID=9301 RepID=UPI003D682583